MSEFSKQNKTVKVVFNKNFMSYYKKGETHYIHEDVVKARGLDKFGTVSKPDFKALYKAAAKTAKRQEKE